MSREILLVEDEPDDVELFRLAAREAGMTNPIREAIDGEQALRLLLEGEVRPLAVLLDLDMPGIGGIETLRRIKSEPPLRRLVVGVLTSFDLAEDQDSVRRLGCELYFIKPKTFASYIDMAGRIRSLLAPPPAAAPDS